MILLHRFIFLSLALLFSMVHLQGTDETSAATLSSSKIGPSACFIKGDLGYDCKLEHVLCDQLPPECSSYLWEAVRVDLNYDVYDLFGPKNDAFFVKLTKCSKRPIYITYGYGSLGKWSVVLACSAANGMNVQDEMEGLQPYLKNHPNIAGLMLSDLDIELGLPTYEDLTSNLKSYIESLRKNLPGLEIGVTLMAQNLQLYYENSTQKWINFKDLSGHLDFFVINYVWFNTNCTKELKYSSLAPITGSFEYTWQKTEQYLDKAGIPKDKRILRIDMGPMLGPFDDFTVCDVNTKMGQYAKENAMGFAVSYVDQDDANCNCQCGRPFPGFYAILDGFNGAPCPQSCALYDGCA